MRPGTNLPRKDEAIDLVSEFLCPDSKSFELPPRFGETNAVSDEDLDRSEFLRELYVSSEITSGKFRRILPETVQPPPFRSP